MALFRLHTLAEADAEAEAAGSASSGDEEWHSVEEGLGGEGEEAGGEAHSRGAGQAERAEQGHEGQGIKERPPSGPAVEDHFADQFDRWAGSVHSVVG